MHNFFHSTMDGFFRMGKLPLWVVYVRKGKHPERLFHDHNYSEIALIIHGPARHILDGENVPINSGDMLIIHPEAVHAYDETGQLEIINLVFDPTRLPFPLLDSCDLPLFQKLFPNDKDSYHSANAAAHLEEKDLVEAVRMILKLEDELKNPQAGNLIYSLALFMEILVFISRKSGLRNSAKQQVSFLIGDTIRYMNHHHAETIDLKTLSRIAKMSERSFSRHFYSAVGCSPIKYLIKIRLQHACELLINDNCSMSEIASTCGFYDSNYFCKQFFRAFSVSPRIFRKRYRSE